MTKASIFFDTLGVFSFDLETKTLKTSDKEITTYYWVNWYCEYGENPEIKQQITKEEYEFLLRELEKE